MRCKNDKNAYFSRRRNGADLEISEISGKKK
jgi:hypothetical protein